ncbi:FliA/WhiG family RNA polymerase sigma factor [Paraburkholderia bonniea]|uniref:FliA/WhiG family RNA polymerase sigma factor n=1 Tax=Paraburkholderia bonniea TaxID=2152891 RepID=UPI0012921BF2|nr:FliA/WhiG family RNA polymerase sigma factor [Paraburkholderia bonniea]WJF90782.1 FliA/WhiG family RNA polymerase sigma factor [Paraburkholderia bonniea]WJF94096.1 FliA/WhiG family RNA polymerase sigma factor [Paraburkholderia bonniea]
MSATTYTEYAQIQRASACLAPADEQRWMIEYGPLVRRVVRKMSSHTGSAVDKEDLEQIGLMGLLEALRRYGEPDDEFQHYALVRVRGAMLDELRRQDWRPRGARQGAHRLRAAERGLRRKLGREPEKEELCAELGIDSAACDQMLLDDSAQELLSFDALLAEQDGQHGQVPGHEAQVLDRISLVQALEALDPREQQVIQLYYEFDLSLAEIAAVLEITTARVCQINKKALQKMRAHLGPH